MKAIVLVIAGSLALGLTGGCSLPVFIGDPYSCGSGSDGALRALPTALPAVLPDYRYVDEFTECDSGGGRGARFRLKDPTENGDAVLLSAGCQPVSDFEPEYPVFICRLGDVHARAEVEDPDIWVRPVPPE
jgi:hypothetical protein